MSIFYYAVVMAGVTYLIRMIPFTAFRKKIQSRFIRDFLAYIPYAVLAAMTIPAIFFSTGTEQGAPITAAVRTVIALVLAYFNCPLIVVALAAAAAALVTGFIV